MFQICSIIFLLLIIYFNKITINTSHNIPNITEACKLLGGSFKNNICTYGDLITCISFNHINKYNSNCSIQEYYNDKCVPKNKILTLWCPQYRNCFKNSDCIYTNFCVTNLSINKCLYNVKQPYCIEMSNNLSTIECD